MKKLLFATINEAKIKQIRSALSPAGIKVDGVQNKENLPDVIEDGATAVENARKKALAYAKYLDETVFSMDNALYLDGLPPEKQPGLHVRRMAGYSDRPTDEEMIEYYSGVIKNLGDRVNGYWEFGICIATPSGKYHETTIRSKRIFVSKPSSQREAGYPLESIQIEPESKKYIAEMTEEEKAIFWQEAIGKPLLKFVKSVNL